MTISVSDAKRMLQDHLQAGLLLVIGSGLSAAEGIPGMWHLAEHLKKTIPSRLASDPDIGWDAVVRALDAGQHLEQAMATTALKESTLSFVVELTADLIRRHEYEVIIEVMAGKRNLPLTIFARHLFRAINKIHVITPNYDRLIEFAVEAAGFGVNTSYVGSLYGTTNHRQASAHFVEQRYDGKRLRARDLPHLCIHKPHGSLDWYEVGGTVVRCPLPLNRSPAIITPGVSKYQTSFEIAFDAQRSSGNAAVGSANRLMFIGYGFNDDHLEHHLCPGGRFDKPTVIVAKEIGSRALDALQRSKEALVIAISAVSDTDLRTRIRTSEGDELIADEQLWHLDGFNKGVL